MRKVHHDFYQFLLAQFPAVMKWTGEGADANAEYKKQHAAIGGSVPASPQPVVEEQKVAAPVAKSTAVKAKPAKKPPTKML